MQWGNQITVASQKGAVFVVALGFSHLLSKFKYSNNMFITLLPNNKAVAKDNNSAQVWKLLNNINVATNNKDGSNI